MDQNIGITCTAADPVPGSGLASSTCANVGGAAYTFPLGTTTFSATATDVAGNTGSGSTAVTVTVTFTSLINLVQQLFSQFDGIDRSLSAKLNAAEQASLRGDSTSMQRLLDAFTAELNAQSGKTLPAVTVATLTQLVQALR